MKGKYSRGPRKHTKSVKARGSDLRIHFKNTRETAAAIKGMWLDQAKKYYEEVLEHKRCVPFRRFHGGIGRTGKAREWGVTLGRFPEKSIKAIQSLLKNAEANAVTKGLAVDKLYVSHIQVQRAQKQRRRTYRAHGRINPYMSSPSHIELILSEKGRDVPVPFGEKRRREFIRIQRKTVIVQARKQNRDPKEAIKEYKEKVASVQKGRTFYRAIRDIASGKDLQKLKEIRKAKREKKLAASKKSKPAAAPAK
eukprot:TRINITY_DN178_c0_g1_i1.p1 TRINITY_DN178_c0_g1~~TRINITY_DN178_c0_g1_i1.p1  ORF type:complete len:252 (-),score=57.65 TRINITY_DN178_c0_g1_i1:69-824(-)